MQPGSSQTASGANVNSPVCFLLLKMQHSLITDDIEHIAGWLTVIASWGICS